MAASSRGRFAAFRRVTCTAGLLVLCLAALCRGPGAQALPVVQTPDTAASASGQSFVPSYVIMPPIKPPQPESFILELKAPSPVHNKTFAEMIERHLQKIVSSAGSGSMAGVALEDLDDRDDDWPEAEPGPGAPAVRAYRTALAEAGLGLASNRTPRARTIIGGNQYGYWIRLDYEYEVIFIWRPLPSKTGSGISRYPSKEGLVTVSSSSSTITTNQASVLMDSGSGSGRATGELPFPTNGTLPGGLEDIVTSVDGDEDRKSPQVVRVNNRLQHKGLLSIQGATADMIDDIRNWAEIKGIEEEARIYALNEEGSKATVGQQALEPNQLNLDSLSKDNFGIFSGSYQYNFTGRNVTVFVLDTGLWVNHLEFEGRAQLYESYAGSDCADCNGHGTHVGGIVGGKTFGVAKEANIFSIKVLGDDGNGTMFDLITGIYDVADSPFFPKVAVMSLGGTVASAALEKALEYAHKRGVVLVAAAGNEADNACSYAPGKSKFVISVGAHDSNGVPSSFSNYGECIDIYAPGNRIRSAVSGTHDQEMFIQTSAINPLVSKKDARNAMVGYKSGTSVAAPHVAGIAAMLLEQNPLLTPDETKALILAQTKITGVTESAENGGTTKPAAYSLIQASPCDGFCDAFLIDLIPRTSGRTPTFYPPGAGPLKAWLTWREEDILPEMLSIRLQKFSPKSESWEDIDNLTEPKVLVDGLGTKLQPQRQVAIRFEVPTAGEPYRYVVSLKQPYYQTFKVLINSQTTPACVAETDCNGNGICSRESYRSEVPLRVQAADMCICSKEFAGDACNRRSFHTMTKWLMTGLGVVFLVVSVVYLIYEETCGRRRRQQRALAKQQQLANKQAKKAKSAAAAAAAAAPVAAQPVMAPAPAPAQPASAFAAPVTEVPVTPSEMMRALHEHHYANLASGRPSSSAGPVHYPSPYYR